MSAVPHQKFSFDTVFDGEGEVVFAAPRVKRMYTTAEVEEIRTKAYAEGERSAQALADAALAQAIGEVARHCGAAMGTLAKVAHDHREAAAGLAMAVGRKIADAALDRFPEAPAAAAMIELAREIESRPALKVSAAPEMAERIEAALKRAAEAGGFAGSIIVTTDAAAPRAAFTFDWGEGRASFDPEAAAARVAEALNTALAAEGLHAEPLMSQSETDHG